MSEGWDAGRCAPYRREVRHQPHHLAYLSNQGRYVRFASKEETTDTDWYHNQGPPQCHYRGRKGHDRGRRQEATGDERDRLYPRRPSGPRSSPNEKKNDRVIPVIVLTPTETGLSRAARTVYENKLVSRRTPAGRRGRPAIAGGAIWPLRRGVEPAMSRPSPPPRGSRRVARRPSTRRAARAPPPPRAAAGLSRAPSPTTSRSSAPTTRSSTSWRRWITSKASAGSRPGPTSSRSSRCRAS